MGVPRAMRVRRETSSKACCQPWFGGVESVIEERRSVSRNIKPRMGVLDCVVAWRYSFTLCCVPRGLLTLCQDRVFRCVSGKRWMWESTIGIWVGVMALGYVAECCFLAGVGLVEL
jgi:hypothetical protein